MEGRWRETTGRDGTERNKRTSSESRLCFKSEAIQSIAGLSWPRQAHHLHCRSRFVPKGRAVRLGGEVCMASRFLKSRAWKGQEVIKNTTSAILYATDWSCCAFNN
jgi:hypothetical protein